MVESRNPQDKGRASYRDTSDRLRQRYQGCPRRVHHTVGITSLTVTGQTESIAATPLSRHGVEAILVGAANTLGIDLIPLDKGLPFASIAISSWEAGLVTASTVGAPD